MDRTPDFSGRQHSHDFHTSSRGAERRTWIVVAITSAMMIVELVAGWLFNSMAVVADGWHMSTHAVALSLTGFTFAYSRRSSTDWRFAFGPWKVETLGGYTSAVLLAGVALFMAWKSVQRMVEPLEIHYGQALVVAGAGLGVNIACALILRGHDSHAGAKHESRTGMDLNTKAAYMHVLADAMTSVLAIVALAAGSLFQLRVLDPLMGIAGGVLICAWALGLLRESSRVLLDREMDHEIVGRIRRTIEGDGTSRVTDLHVRRVGKSRFACELQIVVQDGFAAADYRKRLADHEDIAHSTIEVIHKDR